MEFTNREWKQTELDSLFDIYTGGDLIISRTQKGKIPIISHSMINNGIAEWTLPIKEQSLFNANDTISLADRGNFYAFTQATDFYIGTRVKALKAKFPDPNRFILLFICAMINKQAVKFSYGNNATGGIGKLKILLPVNSSGEPDYAFMESYIKQKEKQLLKQYKKQLSNLKTVIPLSGKEWKEFKLTDLFNFEKGDQNNMARIKVGSVPLVSAKKSDNGYKDFATPAKKLYRGNSLTLNNDGDGGAGISYYQPTNYLLDSHVTALYPKNNLNKLALLYISRSITAQRAKFGHGYSVNNQRLKVFKLMLPINEKGEPDYLYMETYMQVLENEKLNHYLEYKKGIRTNAKTY